VKLWFPLDPVRYVEVKHHEGYSSSTSPYDLPCGFSVEMLPDWMALEFRYLTDGPTFVSSLTVEGSRLFLTISRSGLRLRKMEISRDGQNTQVLSARLLGFLDAKPELFAHPEIIRHVLSDRLEDALNHLARENHPA
jgi:hypothetical protein